MRIDYTKKQISYTHMLKEVMQTLRCMAYGYGRPAASASECVSLALNAIAAAQDTPKKARFVSKLESKRNDTNGQDVYWLCANAIEKAKRTTW